MLNVQHDRIEIDQCDYIDSCVKRYGLEDSKAAKMSMEKNLDIDKINSNSALCVLKFQKLFGLINYIMERTRPDINFAANVLSRKTNAANEEHYSYLQRVLRYLKGTRDTKLIYNLKEDAPSLKGHGLRRRTKSQYLDMSSKYLVISLCLSRKNNLWLPCPQQSPTLLQCRKHRVS